MAESIRNETLTRPLVRSELTAQLPTAQSAAEALLRREFLFQGAWVPFTDPLKIGLNNFSDLQNLRYTDIGLEGVQGYSFLDTVGLSAPRPRNGIHFVKDINGAQTSHLLVLSYGQFVEPGKIFLNQTVVPGVGNFATTPLHTDALGAGLGRFALVPDGNVAYCNGVESTIWGSAGHRVGAVINYDESSSTFRYDITERMQDTRATAGDTFTLVPDAGGIIWLHVGSVRPIQAINFTVSAPNTLFSPMQVEFWNGTTWAVIGGLLDTTSSAGVTLAGSGSVIFDSTVGFARVRFFDQRLMYFYRVQIGAVGQLPSTTIALSHITVNAPWQPIIDLWDGVERKPIQFHVHKSDFTLEVQEGSPESNPDAAKIDALPTSRVVLVGFTERMTALQLRLIAGHANEVVMALTLSYWNGSSWVATNVTDGTSISGFSLGQSGAMVWDAPAATSEFEQELQGVRGYFYQLRWSATTDTDILVDVVTGIPAQRYNAQSPIAGYKFPFVYQNRLMLANRRSTNEGNRIDYSAILAPDVHNGEDSSDQGQAIFIGDSSELTAAIEFSNVFSGVFRSVALLFKANQTWLLTGATPEDFQQFLLSPRVGCPAPLTLAVVDIAVAIDRQTVRNAAVWVSHKGPVLSDGGVIRPMRFPQQDGQISSIDHYFNPNDGRYITTSALENARGWYDARFDEYNLLLPTAGSTTCNAWVACDLQRLKWFRKVPPLYPQVVVDITDTAGASYVYGGIDNGRFLRLEHGLTWGGTPIEWSLDTADMFLSGSMWDETLLRFVKLAAAYDPGGGTVALGHAGNGTSVFTTLTTLPLTVGAVPNRFVRVTDVTNTTNWSHRFRLSGSKTGSLIAPQLFGLGLVYRLEREELS